MGLKPSANQGEARLRGLYRIIYSKTMSVGRGGEAGSAACACTRARNARADVMEIEHLFRSTALAVGLMEIEN